MTHLTSIPNRRHFAVSLGLLLVLLTTLAAPAGAQGWSFELKAVPAPMASPPIPPPAIFPVQLILDDDQADGTFGFGTANGARQFLWFNQFDPPPGIPNYTLEEVWVLFPSGANMAVGEDVQLVVFLDPDGDPSNGANLLATYDVTIQAVDDETFSIYPLVPALEISDPGSVLIGVVARFIESGVTGFTSPSAIDSPATPGRAWFASWTGDPPDPPILPPDDTLATYDQLFLGETAVWMIRGFGDGFVPEVPAASDFGLALLAALLAGGALFLLRRRATLVLLLAALASFSLLAVPAAAQVTIDDYSTAQAVLTLQNPPDSPGDSAASNAAGAGMLGGQRDLMLTWNAGGIGPISTDVAASEHGLDVAVDSEAEVLATWDADSDPNTLDPVGLGGIDLTAGGASAFRLAVTDADANTEIVVTVYTNATDFSRAAKLLPAIASATDALISFAELQADPGGTGADLTNVGAIQLLVRYSGTAAARYLATLFDTVAPVVQAIKADALTNDVDMDGQADPGDTLTYTVTITNDGGEAMNVDLTDMVDANTTLVGGSITATPVAKTDQYTAFGNLTLMVDDSAAKPGVVDNDQDPDGGTLMVSAMDAASAQGGTVTLDNAATGEFTYVPPAGFRGVDQFSYTLQDDDALTDTGTVVIDVSGIVWFVDNTHGGPFEGTQANPFDTMKKAEMASATDDIIRIREGDGTDSGHNLGFFLKPGQRLVGGAADLVVDGQLVEAGTSHSVHSHTSGGNVLDLAGDHIIEGMRLNNSVGHGITSAGASNTVVDDVMISSSGNGDGVSLTNHTGSFTFANGMITSTAAGNGVAVNISGGSGTFDFSGSPVSRDGGGLIHITGTGAGTTHNFTGSLPTLTNGTLDGISLSSNAGAAFTFDAIGGVATGAGDAVQIANSGTVNLNTLGALSATGGAALDIAGTTVVKTGGPGAVTVASASAVNSPTLGISLNGVGPNVTVSGTTTVTNATAGISLVNVDDVTFTGALTVTTTAGAGITATGGDALVASTASNSIVAAAGPALDLNGSNMTLTFATLSSSGSAGLGVNLVSTGGTLDANGGTITGGSGGTAFHVDGGSPTVTYSGGVTQNNAQRVVNIEDTTGGSVGFDTGTVTGGSASLGVRINNADGNSSFADLNLGTSGGPMTNQALTLSGGSTGTHGFAGTQIFTTGANGVHADNGGVVEFTGPGNRVTATSARAITFENGTVIGPNEVTLERVDASGTDRGIRLSSAGTGFTITGSGTTDGTGGTLQNLTARGVEVISTNDISLSNMMLTDAATANGVDPTNANGTCGGLSLGQNLGCNAPVHLQTVNGAVLDNVDILRSAQVGINGHTVTGFALRNSVVTDAGNQTNEFSLKFRDMLGTSEITNSTVTRTISSGTEVDQVRIQNFSSTQLNLTVTNSRFDTNAVDGPTSAFENSGFIVVGHSSSNMRIELVNSFFENNKGSGATVGVNDGTSNADVEFIVTGGTFQNNNVGLEAIGHGSSSTISFDINGATVDDNPAVGINVDLNSTSTASVLLQGHVRNNTVTHTGSGDSIQVNTRGAGAAVVTITGNTLNESGFERAIDVSTQEGSGDLDVVIEGNTLNMTGFNPVRAMNVNSGADTGDTGTLCAKVGGPTALEMNTVNSISGGNTRVRVRRRENTVVNLQGVPGPHPQTNQATIEAYITGQNTGATGNATVGGGFGDAACTVAPIP